MIQIYSTRFRHHFQHFFYSTIHHWLRNAHRCSMQVESASVLGEHERIWKPFAQ